MPGRVAGKIALVTGAASGIGRASAEALAREGASVVLTDIQVARGEEAAAGIAKAGGKAVFRRQDVTSEEAWSDIVGEIQREHGRLDILVNNAGIAVAGFVTELSLEEWRRQQSINVDSVFMGTRAALPLMAKGGGSIINISSIAGLRGAPRLSAYCASKGAVRLFSKAVAIECAALKNGVRVNSIHPGIIETPIWAALGAPGSNLPPDLDTLAQLRVPLGVKGQPADIANAVVFLASDESRYMTGEEMVVDGGMTVGSL
ncbi:MAG TPA: glucose 1-dehydrogenase [Hyphomonadaceae bacterium]|nr:glucose 1-dehydrogenase [Hyphomonadaceae bacterium]